MRKPKLMLGAITGLVAALLLVSLVLPSRWQVERSIEIKAEPADVYSYINDLRRWAEWTSWFQREPRPVTVYSGPDSGAGASSAWRDADGQGQMTITVSVPDWGVAYILELGQGRLHASGQILLAPVAGGTRITWRAHGDVGMNPVARYFALPMAHWIGGDFERSLGNLKRKLESAVKPA